jgi:hypothetical protein
MDVGILMIERETPRLEFAAGALRRYCSCNR